LLWIDRDGKPGPSVGMDATYGSLALSPDGRRVAIDKSDGGNNDIWVIDLDRGIPNRLTIDAAFDTGPRWSNDGKKIFFERPEAACVRCHKIIGQGSEGGQSRYGSEGQTGYQRYGMSGRTMSGYGSGSSSYGGQGQIERSTSARRGPKGWQRSDDRLKEDICERLYHSGDIDSSEVTVTVAEGKVVLDGTVSDRSMKYAMEDLVDNVPGVKDIDNRVRVSRDDGGGQSGQSEQSRQSQAGQSRDGTQSTASAVERSRSCRPNVATRSLPAIRSRPIRVQIHDFPSMSVGKAIPDGIYDVRHNRGFVNVGMSHDTPDFAVESIRLWWVEEGQARYNSADSLLVLADSGGSNSARSRLWKVRLQALSDALQMPITVCHLPPGTSKWNKIEHRLFAYISINWRGRPLVDFQTIVSLIGATSTTTGLTVSARLDLNSYPTGVTVPDSVMAQLALRPHATFPQWNYTLAPRPAA